MEYNTPSTTDELFEQGEGQYSIIDHAQVEEMDNIQSMQHLVEYLGIPCGWIDTDHGTQIVVSHPRHQHKLVIDSYGLGDFFRHGFDVSIYES